MVVDGKAEYGTGSSSLLLERKAGKPVVVLAVIFQHSPYVLIARQTQSIHDLSDKRIMLEPQAIDLDKFKPINDTFGHAVGDLLLHEAAQRMQNCMRQSDTVARIGGDEFVVLLPSLKEDKDAPEVAEKIRHSLNLPFELSGHILSISSSIGVAIYPAHGDNEKELVKNAEIAMYYAKENGRNNVTLYHSGLKDVK